MSYLSVGSFGGGRGQGWSEVKADGDEQSNADEV
jgi:hypothetical protein